MSARCASRDSRTIQRIGRDAGNGVAQTERGGFRSSSLGGKSAPLPEHRFATRYRSGDMRSVFRLGRASRPLHARHICRATTLLWLKSGRVRKDKRRGKSAAAEKWLKRQLEFRDEQKIIGSTRVGWGRLGSVGVAKGHLLPRSGSGRARVGRRQLFLCPFHKGFFWYNTPR